MKTSDFDYDLPEELIAQEPTANRDQCRMLVMDRVTGALEDRIFRDIKEYLRPGDLIIANETRVLPARLLGTKRGTGGAAEVFLLKEAAAPEVDGAAGKASERQAAPEGYSEGCAASEHNPLTTETAGSGAKGRSEGCAASERSPFAPDAPNTSPNSVAYWEVLVKPGRRLKAGAVVDFCDQDGNVALSAEIIDFVDHEGEDNKGQRLARLTTTHPSLDEALHAVGKTPLPPYIKDYTGDMEMYQTVFSKREGSAAAPTAGLHFTPQLIEEIKAMGVKWMTVELEVGLGTFRIVDEENAEDHHIHTEYYTVPEAVVKAVEETKAAGGRVIAIGTTSVRSLESAWDTQAGKLLPRNREATSLYILPGYHFNVVDCMVTNFHVPKSTLMMLVSAFSTRENIMNAYQHAIDERYRMLSFGDAMFMY